MKHTPGPWEVWETFSGFIRISTARSLTSSNPDDYAVRGRIAQCPRRADGRGVHNARLIAAAPDLLLELRGLVALVAAEYPSQQETWLEGARAAIARATGEEG